MNEKFIWQRMKEKDIPRIEDMLRDMEGDCVSVCGRFLKMVHSRDSLWMLCDNKRNFSAVILNSRSTLMPVLCGLKEIPPLKFLDGFLRKKRIHSAQGLLEEVLVMERELKKTGRVSIDTYDYDLMTLDYLPNQTGKKPANLVLRKPLMEDLHELLPLRKGYEEEEVLPKGSVFNPTAGRLNLANFIAGRKMLVAQLNGKIVGKITVNAVSFTRYQIGGVFVLPEYRGRGIASFMTQEFVKSLVNEGKGITLFVKKNNIPAKKLYTSLGFKYKNDYRITYY